MVEEFTFTYEEKKKLAAQTAEILTEEIGLKGDAIQAVHLIPEIEEGKLSMADVEAQYGSSVARILEGLDRIRQLYKKTPAVESENFRNLLLSLAEDMRVILIMIADRVNLMRTLLKSNKTADSPHATFLGGGEFMQAVSQEAAYLYAPLAHKLGLYKLKSELEDLSLKYLEHEAYYHIREKLNETKASRDAYIQRFIGPIEEKVKAAGIKCHIKGRTKSIHSIWQKMQKQKCPFEGVYDLFAIRIIIDCPEAQEKMQCWQAYSIVTDMYQPNPKRLRDWLSVPKSNGYESLHITVLGPEQKWVEVQIRTERMDEIAERGVAAHWRYKGVKGESGLDEWLTNIRSMLEHSDGLEAMDQFKLDLYEDEVFVFTPRGDLLKFPVGATVLDFAYHIHSKVGNQCTGGRINGHVVPIRYLLKSGDQVEVLTSANQKPRQEWLNIVKTSRAKSKIRLALKETQVKDGLFAKEMLERKFKNRKIEMEDSIMFHVVKKMGFKEVSDFYKQIADGILDTNDVIEKYLELKEGEKVITGDNVARSASEFELDESKVAGLNMPVNDDVLIIDRNLKGIDYQLARCCSPIYGDSVFGFVTINGGIKIHRTDCPIGNDDIGIVNNLTSIISKDEKLLLRSINIDSHDGLFSGNLEVMLDDTSRLEALMKKLRMVKGVIQVDRI